MLCICAIAKKNVHYKVTFTFSDGKFQECNIYNLTYLSEKHVDTRSLSDNNCCGPFS